MPRKIGLIASLSKRGEDYRTGGTRFWVDGKEVDAEPAQNVGSVTLFRYDLPHSVSEVDSDHPLEFGTKTGRWVAVFPYRQVTYVFLAFAPLAAIVIALIFFYSKVDAEKLPKPLIAFWISWLAVAVLVTLLGLDPLVD